MAQSSTQPVQHQRLLSLNRQKNKRQSANQRQPPKRSSTNRRDISKVNSQDEALSFYMMHAPLPEQLLQMEHEPVAALLNMATNTGRGRYPESDQRFLEHFKDSGSEIPEHLKPLAIEISRNITDEDRSRLVKDFLQSWNISAPLYVCGCCGVRAFEMGGTKFHKASLEDIRPLQFTSQQVEYLEKIPTNYR